MRELLRSLEEFDIVAWVNSLNEEDLDAVADQIDEKLSSDQRLMKRDYKQGEKDMERWRGPARKVQSDSLKKYSTKELMQIIRGGKTGEGKSGISSNRTPREAALVVLRQRMSRGKKGINKKSIF